MIYKIVWDNGHASGSLIGKFETKEQAEAFADDWLREMIAIDDDPKAAEEAYSYDIIESGVFRMRAWWTHPLLLSVLFCALLLLGLYHKE